MTRLRIKLMEDEKHALLQIRVDKTFRTKSRITRRTLEVAKAFGIGVDEEKVFCVFKDFEVEVDPGDIVYVTGESGAGKSILLKAIARELSRHPEFGGVIMDEEIEVDPGEILIHGVGVDAADAMRILSHVGLNEAYLFLRRYGELSDGQKYRYRLAKAFWSGRKTIIFDEFAATLDRVTARVVAYLVQKFCRKHELTFIAATTHEDLIEDLNPDLLIWKGFGAYVDVKKLKPEPRPCSILRHVRIEEGTYGDYKSLSQFHYIGRGVCYIRKIFRALVEADGRRELAGVIVYTHPYFDLAARNIAIPELKVIRRKIGRKKYAELIDKCFSRIARVVVHPKYRGIGLGVMLVRETLPLAGTPYVEALAVMARYNPFFEKAKMKRIEYESKTWEDIGKFLVKLESMGIQPDLIHSKRYLRKVLGELPQRDLEKLASLIKQVYPFRWRKDISLRNRGGIDVEGVVDVLTRIRAKPEYFIWRNPDIPSPINFNQGGDERKSFHPLTPRLSIPVNLGRK